MNFWDLQDISRVPFCSIAIAIEQNGTLALETLGVHDGVLFTLSLLGP